MNKNLTNSTQSASSTKTSHRRYEHLLHSIHDGIVVLDNNLTILIANEAFLRRLHIGLTEVINRPYTELSSD